METGTYDGDFTMPTDAEMRAKCAVARARLSVAMSSAWQGIRKDWATQPRIPAGKPNGGEWMSAQAADGGRSQVDHAAAIKHYTGAGHKSMNWALRGVRPMTPEVKSKIDDLDAALLGASLPEQATVYRGITSMGAKALVAAGLKKGAVLEDPGFMSTTRSAAVARQFAQQSADHVILEIKAPKGSQGIDVSKQSDTGASEQEILFARNQRIKVISFDKKSRVLKVEMMASEMKKAKSGKRLDGVGGARSRFEDDLKGIKVVSTGDGEPIDFDMNEKGAR